MSIDTFLHEALIPFLETGEISDILHIVKSGKEATVVCCRGGSATTHALVAAKVYRPEISRSFRQSSTYQAGRVQLAKNTRLRRALQKNSEFGKQMAYRLWVHDEWQTMCHLHAAGVDLPEPIAVGERAVLMQFIGDEDGAAPRLHEADITRARDVDAVLEDLLDNVACMLHADRVHGDLSPYNVLYHRGRSYIIDFPQAVDPRLHGGSGELLRRDIASICAWAVERGVRDLDAEEITHDLWTAFRRGELG